MESQPLLDAVALVGLVRGLFHGCWGMVIPHELVGQWDYHIGYIVSVNRTVTVDAQHYASGVGSRTWRATQ